jgi:membrane protein YdbS with pleckstrin-like domain
MNPSARNSDDSEATLWEGNYSAKAMIGSWLLGIVATVLLLAGGIFLNTMFPGIALLVAAGLILLLWIALGLQLLYRKWSVRYQLTNQRFIHRRGILKQVTDRIETIDMDDITFEQGIVQRMLGVGTIRITSSDRTHPELRLIGIEDVQRIANLIDSARRKERVRRGIHIEAV